MAERLSAGLDGVGLKRAVVAGQASGGLYALAFAQKFPGLCQGVCLIDTGVPFTDKGDLMRLPNSIRRTMLPARYFPEVLYLPHRLVAANFRRSRRGEASVIDYFFNGSPADQMLTRSDQASFAVTRAIISYSFDDTDRLVQDVARWANDWTDTLLEVAAKHRVRFIHGAQNTMFKADKIEDFVDRHPNVDHRILPGGQLAIFQEPDAFSTALGELGSTVNANDY